MIAEPMRRSGGYPTELRRLRILTTHPKDNQPLWRSRTELLKGWVEEAARTGDAPMPFWWSLRWGWRLLWASRHYDAVVTGFERPWWVFAFLQGFIRRRRVPHVMLYIAFALHGGPIRQAVQRIYYRWLFYPFVLRTVDRVLVFSRYQIDLYKRVLGLPLDKFVNVPYHTTIYDAPHRPSAGNYVFSGGDFTRDYPSLIEAVRGLPYRVIIAARFRHCFNGVAIPPNVEVVTTTPQGFLDLMAGAGVVVVPLRGGLLHSGGQQTYLNAMLMGKPTVVLDDCGADEYLTDGKNGVLLAPGDVTGLRKAIVTLMEDREMARRLGQEATSIARAFSPERFAQRALAVIAGCAALSSRDQGREQAARSTQCSIGSRRNE